MSKLKEVFCYADKPLGKFSEWVVKAGVSAEITIDTKDTDKIITYCWCCALWRGIALGGLVGFIVGVLI